MGNDKTLDPATNQFSRERGEKSARILHRLEPRELDGAGEDQRWARKNDRLPQGYQATIDQYLKLVALRRRNLHGGRNIWPFTINLENPAWDRLMWGNSCRRTPHGDREMIVFSVAMRWLTRFMKYFSDFSIRCWEECFIEVQVISFTMFAYVATEQANS